MKKVIALVSVAVFLASAVPAFGFGYSQYQSSSDIDVNVNNTDTTVTNNLNTSASTGGNQATGGGLVVTGHAWATSSVQNGVNLTDVKVRANCGCKGDIAVGVDNDDTTITNNLNTSASTGGNQATGGSNSQSHHGHYRSSGSSNGGSVYTGNADAFASVVNVVNTNIVRVRR